VFLTCSVFLFTFLQTIEPTNKKKIKNVVARPKNLTTGEQRDDMLNAIVAKTKGIKLQHTNKQIQTQTHSKQHKTHTDQRQKGTEAESFTRAHFQHSPIPVEQLKKIVKEARAKQKQQTNTQTQTTTSTSTSTTITTTTTTKNKTTKNDVDMED
jgi:hypothetical protein